MKWDHSRRISRLVKRIPPAEIVCKPGCFTCCKAHAWTWTEWEKVEDKRYAKSKTDPCPYASVDGCAVYEQRPVICRIYGLAWDIGMYRGEKIRMACPEDVIPVRFMEQRDAMDVFKEYMKIIQTEVQDRAEDGLPLFAGPYGTFSRLSRL